MSVEVVPSGICGWEVTLYAPPVKSRNIILNSNIHDYCLHIKTFNNKLKKLQFFLFWKGKGKGKGIGKLCQSKPTTGSQYFEYGPQFTDHHICLRAVRKKTLLTRFVTCSVSFIVGTRYRKYFTCFPEMLPKTHCPSTVLPF